MVRIDCVLIPPVKATQIYIYICKKENKISSHQFTWIYFIDCLKCSLNFSLRSADYDLVLVGLVLTQFRLWCVGFAILAYMPMLKACSSRWKCWVGSDKTRLESRQGCQTRPRPSDTSLTRLWTGSPSMHTDWSGSKSMLSSETVRMRKLEPRSLEMATRLWDHTV